ncbi:MAG: efflux RND transporter periplasmic adaptor subunit [Shewanella sp.]|nr:efflux RND transporter periplasmic adaptor subunit [Shewanella sp.]MCF1459696.1 efflux RND transporter periplasmic adaptor subunit [Shewanella sp.]
MKTNNPTTLSAVALSLGLCLSAALFYSYAPAAIAGPGHGSEQKQDDHAEEGVAFAPESAKEGEDEHGLHLSAQQLKLASIEVMPVSEQSFSLSAVATATLSVDRDKTVTLAPQLDVRVLARHVVPGQEVKDGQPLLTLGGAAVAQAQADYIKAAAEWQRVSRMNKSAVSASRRLQAQVDAELKRAILEALKMTPAQIKALESRPEAIGQYQLLSPIEGRVQQDVAQRGQVFAAGTALMQLTNESYLWVEAQITPAQAENIEVGAEAMVRVGDKLLPAEIIGRSHELNTVTRTEQVLARMHNPGHVLHAGQFAELYLRDIGSEGVVLPDAALTRSVDGHWQVFVAEGDGFEAKEITVVECQRGMNLVQGLHHDDQVVVSGAFFLASEQAKSGFDIHNH